MTLVPANYGRLGCPEVVVREPVAFPTAVSVGSRGGVAKLPGDPDVGLPLFAACRSGPVSVVLARALLLSSWLTPLFVGVTPAACGCEVDMSDGPLSVLAQPNATSPAAAMEKCEYLDMRREVGGGVHGIEDTS